MYWLKKILSLFVISITMLFCDPQLAYCKSVIGWVERVSVHPGNYRFKARIDSGAKTSSLHCDCQQVFFKGGEQWVKIDVTNDKGQLIHLEKKLERIIKVKRDMGDVQQRMVIKLGICLSNVYKEIEVNIADRSALNYPMLIGRNFLAGDFLIDPGVSFLHKPACSRE